MIRLEKASVSFSQGGSEERIVLRDFSIEVPRGQTVSIIGSNGAGKSTLLNAIAGTVAFRSGSIFVDGRDCTRDPEWTRACYVGRVRQNPLAGTAGEMSILDNLAIASRKGARRLRLAVTPAFARELADRAAELGMGLENRLRENVSKLSGGQPGNAEIVSALTKLFIAEYGFADLIVTHDMKRALEQAERVVMMHEGGIVADVQDAEKDRLGVADLVELFRKARGTDYAEDRDLLR